MSAADLDKQPDSVSSVLKVFGILQALGEEREIGITELSQRVMMSKSTVLSLFADHEIIGVRCPGRGIRKVFAHAKTV
ncbi:Transcriptional regulator kdgR [Kluyvera cryocrescens]|uniref:Transcriptional regulator kdgR n=1 Tax=Kluyvera cryocrescens TaxID=580 RepID=A0A485A4M8_KLUCR|nr:Transcriptional regulator kdgR [Kluyvera cryocrescens]